MEWLVTHMWIALGAMGLFGILFGWAVRGIMVMGKLHRAIGAKEIASAELIESRNELDVLLKAQRGEIPVQPVSGASASTDHVLKAELKDREKRLTDVSAELATSKRELEAMKSSKSGSAAAAAVGGVAAGVGAAVLAGKDEAETPSLAWRNRHLEARLTELEGQIETFSAVEQAPALSGVPVVAAADAENGETDVAADKAAWQVTYLNQRIAALEDELLAAPAASIAVVEAVEPAGDTILTAVVPDADPSSEESNAADEELARLRWRNRFLEGRLAYFEGDSDSVEDDDGNGVGALAAAGAATAALAATALTRDDDDLDIEELEVEDLGAQIVPDSVEAVQEAVEAVSDELTIEEEGSVSDAILKSLTQADEAADAESTDSDDVLPEENFDYSSVQTDVDADVAAVEDESIDADIELVADVEGEIDADDGSEVQSGALDLTQPLALESPVGGQGDDLTVIGGVGPKIQEVLNGLGVYHYDQIAAWTSENIAWIDDHLSFSGRIDREGWVEQARILAGDE